VSQYPPAGDGVTLPVGARARLTISSTTPQTVDVPDLLGHDVDAAVAALDATGLAAHVERVCPGGTPTCTGAIERAGQVWEQSPEVGPATAGDAVILRVFPSTAE
jgi:beta-lactam-binding protein with PASTA domain